MYPTQLHSYLLWRSSVKPDSQSLASRRFTAAVCLLPACMVGIFVFGWYAGVILGLSLLTALVTDIICHRFIFKESSGTRDGIWVLTGLLLAMMMPPNVPMWLPVVGAIIAIFLGKHYLSVDGMPWLQPALVGLVALHLIGLVFLGNNPMLGMRNWERNHWPVLSRDIEPADDPQKIAKDFLGGDVRKSVSRKTWRERNFAGEQVLTESNEVAEAVHAPRPLDKVKASPTQDITHPGIPDADAGATYDGLKMVLGYVPGTIGGSCSLALAFGILLLVFTGTNSWTVPVFGMGTLFAGLHFFAWLYGGSSTAPIISQNVIIHLLTGSTLLGFFYFAADPATAPRSFMGRVYAGVAFGVIELLLRMFTPLSEGFFISVLILQGSSIVFDQWLAPPVEENRSSPNVGLSTSSLGRL